MELECLILDKSTLKELAEFRYELTSYRMVYGTEDAHFGRNLEWQKFKANETRKEFFEQLCAEGKIEEARILFTRYIDIQQNLIKRAANKKLLSVFKQVVSGFSQFTQNYDHSYSQSVQVFGHQ